MAAPADFFELKSQRDKLVQQRGDVIAALHILKAQRSSMAVNVYNAKKNALGATDNQISKQIAGLNMQIQKAHQYNHPTWTPTPVPEPPPTTLNREAKRDLIKDLSELRVHYEKMSRDHTRVASIRATSGNIAQDLSSLIRKHIKTEA